uniref:Bulb-type lectin domain-containing protein n=1 Tax=Pygocentrus nattereri TaxID=42514 RepID=A0AAR2J2B1_PYGNA
PEKTGRMKNDTHTARMLSDQWPLSVSALFQDDGNFVVYGWKPIWASDTCGKAGTRLIMQGDGNLVLYICQPLWASNSWQNSITNDNSLFINNDGNLAVQRGSTVLWTSKK